MITLCLGGLDCRVCGFWVVKLISVASLFVACRSTLLEGVAFWGGRCREHPAIMQSRSNVKHHLRGPLTLLHSPRNKIRTQTRLVCTREKDSCVRRSLHETSSEAGSGFRSLAYETVMGNGQVLRDFGRAMNLFGVLD